jgi:hypothetical protein
MSGDRPEAQREVPAGFLARLPRSFTRQQYTAITTMLTDVAGISVQPLDTVGVSDVIEPDVPIYKPTFSQSAINLGYDRGVGTRAWKGIIRTDLHYPGTVPVPSWHQRILSAPGVVSLHGLEAARDQGLLPRLPNFGTRTVAVAEEVIRIARVGEAPS